MHTTKTQGAVVQSIMRALDGLRFGSIEITVHESQVVQIERKEKMRFDANSRRKHD